MKNSTFFRDTGSTIESMNDLTDLVKQLGDGDLLSEVCLRGQVDAEWSLLPTIGRERHYWVGQRTITKFSKQQEEVLLHRFRRQAYASIGRHTDEWETLFLARHHGLPVRLLDWTANPLVALYCCCFCERESVRDGAIWAFRTQYDRPSLSRHLDVFDPSNPRPLEVKGVRVIYPVYSMPRMAAQAGLFTIQSDPWTGLEHHDPKGFDDKAFDLSALVKWRVPASRKGRFLQELERMGINARSLFPGLDGLGKGLWHTEVLRHGEDSGTAL